MLTNNVKEVKINYKQISDLENLGHIFINIWIYKLTNYSNLIFNLKVKFMRDNVEYNEL